MKKFLSAAVLSVLAAAAFAQSQVDVSVALQAPDLNKAPVNKISGYGDQTSSKALNLDTNVKFTYTAKLDDANTLKAGASVDLYTPFFAGSKDNYKSQLAAKVIEPFLQYQGYGADLLTSLAVYTFNPSDTGSGSNALGFYTGPFFGNKAAKDNAFPLSNYLKATYKYSVDKTLAVVAGVETDAALVPVLFLLDAKPQVSVIWTFLQIDTKYNLTIKAAKAPNAEDASKNFTYSYLEPKLTVDFSSFDASLKGLKAYAGGKFIVATSNGDKLKGSSVQPGLSYSTSIPGVPGTLGFDTNVKVNNIGPDNVADDTYYDFNLKCSYSLKF